jgi:hypothetical protein
MRDGVLHVGVGGAVFPCARRRVVRRRGRDTVFEAIDLVSGSLAKARAAAAKAGCGKRVTFRKADASQAGALRGQYDFVFGVESRPGRPAKKKSSTRGCAVSMLHGAERSP